MNSLSWLLYWAYVLPNFSVLAGFFAFVMGVVFVFSVITKAFANSGDKEAMAIIKVPVISYSWLIFILLLLPALFIPSRETFYLIAGSEAGEYVVNTPESKAILSDVQEVIRLQLEALKQPVAQQ